MYPFANFNGSTLEIGERISKFIPHFTGMWLVIYAKRFPISTKFARRLDNPPTGANLQPNHIVLWAIKFGIGTYILASRQNKKHN